MKARSAYVLDHLEELVVKETRGSGGYGMLVGPHANKKTRDAFAKKVAPQSLSLCRAANSRALNLPDLRWRQSRPRHVTSICGRSCSPAPMAVRIVPGGLTRVALQDGSLVVNSSQGGGTKDTWVLHANGATNGKGAR